MQELMAELQQLGALDPTARDQLTDDLQNTDPALWPGLLHQARAVAAYRQRAAQQQVAPRAAPPEYASAAMVTASGRPHFPPPAGSGTYPQTSTASYDDRATDPMSRLPVASYAALTPGGAPQQRYPTTGFPQSDVSAGSDGVAPPQPQPVEAAPEESPTTVPSAESVAESPAPAKQRSEVQSASYTPAEALDWTGHVDSAIRLLEESSGDGPEEQVRLRMLYIAKGRYDDAVRAISGFPEGKQEFWTSQFHGLGTLLDEARNPDAPGRTAEAKQVLAEAASQLGELAPLVVRNLSFCTRVHSYGCFEPFASCEFLPEQRVLLYAEVDNFTSESTARGYHTVLRSSYQIFDASGQRVADEQLVLTEETCQNRRRDFFIVYDFHLPTRIYPGKHTLRLTVEDLKGKKIGDSCIDLEIVSESGARSR